MNGQEIVLSRPRSADSFEMRGFERGAFETHAF